MNRLRMLSEEKEKRVKMETSESKVIRIVNLAKDTKKYELIAFLREQMNLQGEIEKIYIRNDYNLDLVFAYVIFTFSCDARTAAATLNCVIYKSLHLDVAQIAPNGNYKKYSRGSRLLEALRTRRQQERSIDLDSEDIF